MERPSDDQQSLPALPLDPAEPKGGVLNTLDRLVDRVAKALLYVGIVGLMGMCVLIVADVIGIKILSRPIPGGIEYVSFVSVIMIAFCVPYAQVKHAHIAVDFIIDSFPRRIRLVVNILTVLLSVVLFALLALYAVKFGNKLRIAGEVSMTREIAFYPFVYAMAFCFVVMVVVLLRDLFKSIAKGVAQWTR
jgi:TRAP-type C4-dicarboxylate transport system permease small subunit